eukprot:1210643-Amphidinium_carterae.1
MPCQDVRFQTQDIRYQDVQDVRYQAESARGSDKRKEASVSSLQTVQGKTANKTKLFQFHSESISSKITASSAKC